MKVEQIGIYAASIGGSRYLVALEPTRPIGPTLEVIGLREQGYQLTLTDPMGAFVWGVLLSAETAVGGPDFGSDKFMKDRGIGKDGD